MTKGYNLPDNCSPGDPDAPWNQTSQSDQSNYRYETPQTRQSVAKETLDWLDEVYTNLLFLEHTNPEEEDFFQDSFKHLDWIKLQIRQYQIQKVEPWLVKKTEAKTDDS